MQHHLHCPPEETFSLITIRSAQQKAAGCLYFADTLHHHSRCTILQCNVAAGPG